MSDPILNGLVSFVNHEKKYILIEYDQKGRKKNVNGSIEEKNLQQKHRFQTGDTVSFKIKLSGRGDRMMATEIKFHYNTGLDVLLNRARTENNFTGYLKIVDGSYFVKEIDTYLFFPTAFSPWQIKPAENELNEAVTFSLENTDNKEKISASLYHKKFIPEYYSAVKAFKTGSAVEARVDKISPHGIYLSLFGNAIKAKLPLKKENVPTEKAIKAGDIIPVRIAFLSEARIIVEEFR